ncbi:MAG: MFS transporter [Acetivibrionales bacterium]|jgi:MFS family permease
MTDTISSTRKSSGRIIYIIYNLLHFTALYAARPYISLLASANGADGIEISAIVSSYSIAQVLCAIPAGKLIDRMGSRIPSIGGALLFLLGVTGLSFGRSLFFIAVCTMMTGVSHVIVLLAGQYAMTGMESGERRGKYVGMLFFTNSAGTFIGPSFGAYMQELLGVNRGFLGAVAAGSLCLAVAMFVPDSRARKNEGKSVQLSAVLGNKPIVKTILVNGMFLFTSEVIVNYFPLYAKEIGLPIMVTGVVFSANGLMQMVVRPFLGRIAMIFKRDRLLQICLLAGGLGILCYGLAESYWQFLIISGLTGASLGLTGPLALLLVCDISPDNMVSQVLSLRVMGNYLGQSISPIFFGFMANIFGLAPVFWISGIGLSLSTGLVSRVDYHGGTGQKTAGGPAGSTGK